MDKLHKVSIEWLRKIADPGKIVRLIDPPMAAEKDLSDKGLIKRYGRGRSRAWTITDLGRTVLDTLSQTQTVVACAACKTQINDETIGVELRNVYDGVILWRCKCGGLTHRFSGEVVTEDDVNKGRVTRTGVK